MVRPTAGEVILLPFPLSDLTQSKVCPTIFLASVGRGGWILCQITSNPYGDPAAISLFATDFSTGGVPVASFARPGELFTAHAGLMLRLIGVLTPASLTRMLAAVVALLQPPTAP